MVAHQHAAGQAAGGVVARVNSTWGRLQRVPPVAFVLAIQRRWSGALCGDAHGHLVYAAFKAIFPLLLAALAVLGFVASDVDARAEVEDAIRRQFPMVDDVLIGNLGRAQDLRTLAGVLAFVGLAWIGIGLVETLRGALDRIWAVPTLPNPWLARLRSLSVLGIVGVLLLASLGATGGASALLASDRFGGVLVVAQSAITFVLDLGILLVAYTLLPSGRQRVREAIVGALFAAVVIGGLRGFAFYIVPRWIEGASAAYGTLAGVVALMTFLDLSIRAFLYGAIINAERADRPVVRPVATPAQRGPGEPADPASGGAPARAGVGGVAATTIAIPATSRAGRGHFLGFLAIAGAFVFARRRSTKGPRV